MTKISLDGLSLPELNALKRRVDIAIATLSERRKREKALTKLHAVAKSMGFTVDELLNAKGGGTGSRVAPKYRNPKDSSQTWSGRGRTPAWVKEAKAAGSSMEDLLISK